jgi:hypothetical protein
MSVVFFQLNAPQISIVIDTTAQYVAKLISALEWRSTLPIESFQSKMDLKHWVDGKFVPRTRNALHLWAGGMSLVKACQVASSPYRWTRRFATHLERKKLPTATPDDLEPSHDVVMDLMAFADYLARTKLAFVTKYDPGQQRSDLRQEILTCGIMAWRMYPQLRGAKRVNTVKATMRNAHTDIIAVNTDPSCARIVAVEDGRRVYQATTISIDAVDGSQHQGVYTDGMCDAYSGDDQSSSSCYGGLYA